jgi:hypothetical protein
MRVIFCADPLHPTQADPDFRAEEAAARVLGLSVSVIDHDALVSADDAGRAVARVAPATAERAAAVYRGWMMTATQYEGLHAALLARGLRLVNTPEQYRRAHEYPASHPLIAAWSPPAIWLEVPPAPTPERVAAALTRFGAAPVVVKDFVKSRKHEWAEACFIPNAADTTGAHRVISRFLELQGEDLYGGLVFRAFVPLRPVGTHPLSGAPVFDEHRLFFLDGRVVLAARYWTEVAYAADDVPIEDFAALALGWPLRFFAMDIARQVDGDWTIIELGDAQVTGLPEHADPGDLYAPLALAR